MRQEKKNSLYYLIKFYKRCINEISHLYSVFYCTFSIFSMLLLREPVRFEFYFINS